MVAIRAGIVVLFATLVMMNSSRSADEPAAESKGWWAFQPLQSPPVPKSPFSKVERANPIDSFIHAQLATRQLKPSATADRRTLIRRLTFDLIGLPPTTAEVDAFLRDESPNAYEKLVDRLLASPHFGERWARYWMDAAHFAETHGNDQDRVRPNAWRYRDYLIDSINADVPYTRFIQEQIAVDALYPNEPSRLPALGFLAAGPWDESSLRDIRDDSIDRQIGYYLDRDDMITTAMSTVVSLTVGCARCHDHKFDPIPIDDYYRLQAVFAGAGRGNVMYDLDRKTTQKRKELTALLKAIDANDPSVKPRLAEATFQQEVRTWEQQQNAKLNPWQPIELVSAVAEQGCKLTPMPDGSVRSTFTKRPERDTYSVTFRTKLPRITAVRLELLTDDKFPHRGPGLQDNGNLHLSEVAVQHGTNALKLGTPTSDFDQEGWTVRHAVDGNTATAWGIYPKVGVPHVAIFPVATAITNADTQPFTIQLKQLHGDGHLIGRFRVSVTAEDKPGLAQPLPPPIVEALSVPVADRTPMQRDELGRYVLRQKVNRELGTIPAPLQVYAVSANFEPDASHKPIAKPRTVHLLKRGDIRKPDDEMTPGTLSCIPGLSGEFDIPENATDGQRRAALAKWLTDPKNPLVWRSIVNRIWQAHFGRGIVDTPNDFGKMGGKPTHPELLNYLAVWFRDTANGSLKKLHKLMVMSETYRQQSTHNAAAAKVDEDNRLLWRMPRTKLDAEQVRDAILLVSGRLDMTRGGPSDQQFAMRPGIHVTPIVEYGPFKWDRPEGHRRSVYRFVFRTLPDPLVDCLDGADASQLTPTRNASVTAPQALALLNNDFMLAHAKAMASDLEKCGDLPTRIDTACRRLWGRAPTAQEQTEFQAFATKHGMANLCRVLLNSDDFLFID